MAELMNGLVSLGEIEVERARLSVAKSLQGLGAVLEQRVITLMASEPEGSVTALAREHLLRANSLYREARALSDSTPVSQIPL